MTKVFNSIAILLLLAFCWLMLRLSLPYFSLRYDVDFLLTKQKIIHLKVWRYAFYVHIALSIFSLIAGLTQFSDYLLKHQRKLHRLMGYVYVTDVLCLAGPSGLIMAFYANGTMWAKLSFMILALMWIIFTAIALKKARTKNFTAHRNWMIRSYALTLSAISLRLYAWLLPQLMHMNAFDEYTLISWSSWTINLIVAEILIVFKAKNPPLQ